MIYKVVKNNIIFTNYDFITEEKPFNPDEELEENKKYLVTTLEYALETFKVL